MIFISSLSQPWPPHRSCSPPPHQKHIPLACLMPAELVDVTMHSRIDQFALLSRPEAFWNLWEFSFFAAKLREFTTGQNFGVKDVH